MSVCLCEFMDNMCGKLGLHESNLLFEQSRGQGEDIYICSGCVCTQVYVCASQLRINRQELQRQRHGQSICWLQRGRAGQRELIKMPKEIKEKDRRTENE